MIGICLTFWAEILFTSRTSNSELSIMFCCFFRQNIALVVFYFIVYLSLINNKGISTLTSNNPVNLLIYQIIILSSQNLSDFSIIQRFSTMRTSNWLLLRKLFLCSLMNTLFADLAITSIEKHHFFIRVKFLTKRTFHSHLFIVLKLLIVEIINRELTIVDWRFKFLLLFLKHVKCKLSDYFDVCKNVRVVVPINAL